MALKKIVSGGQTGVDRAALDAALDLGVSCGGWCPKGRLAEDGSIPACYPLQETASRRYRVRTRQNVRDSDATLILNLGPLEGGTALTAGFASEHDRPCMLVDLDGAEDIAYVLNWLEKNNISVLNVAGPRASKRPDMYKISYEFMRMLIQAATKTACPNPKKP